MANRGGFALLFTTTTALAACHPASVGGRALHVASRLDCPAAQGALNRISVAADGRGCVYAGPQGEAVTLQLLATDGRSPQAALAPIEADLKRDVPTRGPAPPRLPTPPGRASDRADEDDAKIDLPGLHIDAHGDHAKVKVAGVSIDADGDRTNVDVGRGGGMGKIASVRSDDRGAEIRSGSVTGRDAELILVLASMSPGPTGDHAGGYVARGPVSGPLVVGVLKAPAQGHGGGDPFRDVKRLVNRNVSR